jgi:agmatine/peptidylarginine deiminase
LAAVLGKRTVRAPITIHHGNLLSNGRGLCIATTRLIQENIGRGYDADDVAQILRKFYGAKEVVFLDRLRGEPTGHVDMFATFTSPDVVVIGKYSRESDPVNAAILDRNAERLAVVPAPCGPLDVVRVPMPPRMSSEIGFWPTYTNVAYANGTLLVPVCPGRDPEGKTVALGLYRRLLPDWTIVGIDVSSILIRGGGIHCVTASLPDLENVPGAATKVGPPSASLTN